MKRLKLTKMIASLLVVASVLALNPIGASAEWKQVSNGYTANDTTVNGYKLGSDGAWIQDIQNKSSNVKVLCIHSYLMW